MFSYFKILKGIESYYLTHTLKNIYAYEGYY